jgi:hypothetical protein
MLYFAGCMTGVARWHILKSLLCCRDIKSPSSSVLAALLASLQGLLLLLWQCFTGFLQRA